MGGLANICRFSFPIFWFFVHHAGRFSSTTSPNPTHHVGGTKWPDEVAPTTRMAGRGHASTHFLLSTGSCVDMPRPWIGAVLGNPDARFHKKTRESAVILVGPRRALSYSSPQARREITARSILVWHVNRWMLGNTLFSELLFRQLYKWLIYYKTKTYAPRRFFARPGGGETSGGSLRSSRQAVACHPFTRSWATMPPEAPPPPGLLPPRGFPRWPFPRHESLETPFR